jgi:DNA-binding IclR family transcriptional regulator
MLGTVQKAGRVLALFTEHRPEWGVTEVARELRIPKSSSHSLLAALAEADLLGRTHDNRYRLGWRLLSLSRTLLDSSEIVTHARPTIRRLTQRHAVKARVAVLHHGEVTDLHKSDGRLPIPSSDADVGRQFPAHGTAVGKVLLAYGPPGAVEELAATRGLDPLTARTITSVDRLQAELADVRRRGWSYAGGELIDGLSCFAAPVFGPARHVEAAISVSVGAQEGRKDPERYARLALAAAASVGRDLREASELGHPAAQAAG